MSEPKVIYLEKYRAGELMITDPAKLPERMPYMNKRFRVESIEMQAAGKLDDGREFQDVRIYTKEA